MNSDTVEDQELETKLRDAEDQGRASRLHMTTTFVRSVLGKKDSDTLYTTPGLFEGEFKMIRRDIRALQGR